METNELGIIVVTIAGVIGAKDLIYFLVKRFTEKRENNATAEKMELEVAHNAMNAQKEVITTLREESARKATMIADKDKKIDELYIRIRELEDKNMDLIFDKQAYEIQMRDKDIESKNLQIRIKDLEYRRCDRPEKDCDKRIPKRITNNQQDL